MNGKVLIIGNHPISVDLVRQYRQRGDDIVCLDYEEYDSPEVGSFTEVCLMADYNKNPMEADNEVMGVLEQIASAYTPEKNHGRKLLCHLLLRSQSLLRLVRIEGFCKHIEEKLEINPYTVEDQWSQTIALYMDREPIPIISEKIVHLVLFGMSQTAEQIAVNTALVCHYPNNLLKDHSLRTRITIIDEAADERSAEWIQRYKHLFDNSFYRFVDTQKHPSVTKTLQPRYHERGNFVDVEWEFVSASPYDALVRGKMSQWATSASQLLSIVIVNENTEQGLNDALQLPEEVVFSDIPVYVYMKNDKAFQQIQHSGNFANIRPFGMVSYGYDINLPYVQMGKTINYIYNQCRAMESNNGEWKMEYAVEVDDDKRKELWSQLPFVKRMSSIYNAMTIGVKMRSMGFEDYDWEKFYDLSQEQIEILAQVEHNRWCMEELILGWRPCNDDEQREVEVDIKMKEELKKRKIHYDLRPYHDLRPDASGKPVQIYDRCLSACIPLIAKESKGGTR